MRSYEHPARFWTKELINMSQSDAEELLYDGRHYDLVNEDVVEDIPFFLRQAKKYGEPVLELACGTGRITIPLAEQGFQITGLDINDSMLAQARRKSTEKGLNIEWLKSDCRDFNLNRKFNLIFIPFNTLVHLLDLKSIESCFACARRHLADQGRFIVDVFNPRLEILIRDSSKRYPVAEYTDPDGRGEVVITENNVYEKATQINRLRWYYRFADQTDEIVQNVDMRIYYPQELDMLLHYNGFAIDAKYGNYDETPFVSTSPKQIVVSRSR
jgi:ubiquinone/menaquinone biosynthesis C-methylase UbiE